jgi:hypothetical protein
LEQLSVGGISTPVSNSKGSRLFCLKAIEKAEFPPFKEIEEEIKKELTQEAVAYYDREYRHKLRKQYGLSDPYLSLVVPSHLQPFSLK